MSLLKKNGAESVVFDNQDKLALSEKGEGGDKLALQRLLREIEAGQLQLKNAARNIR